MQDFSTILPQPASDWNHAFFVQDAWTPGHGLTFNLGLRIEKERLPVPSGILSNGVTVPKSIDFSWGDKIAPRLGVAWDVMRNGKMKVFGSYGVVNDVMKLLLAQTSWGAQSYEWCVYGLGPDASGGFNASDVDLAFKDDRACPNGLPTIGANFASGAPPQSLVDTKSGISLIENVNLRPMEPVAPGVKPYRQHEYVAGLDYQIAKSWAFEARYDRRRLDHVIEDSSLSDKVWGETYAIVNPGEGVNRSLDGYASFLTSLGQSFGVPGWAFNDTTDYGPGAAFGACSTCPLMAKAIRDYDGLEFRLTKTTSKHWAGMFSYTWSRLWGNYTGLTTTDQNDGGITGRNSPDTTRAFDEPFYYFAANGKSSNGLLPTDRPNVFKGYAYYQLPWLRHMNTTFGLFQVAYQGTPITSYIDLAATASNAIPFESTYLYGRGNWVNLTTDATGNIAVGAPYSRRTPWYTQTNFNIKHEIPLNKNNEHQILAFEATFVNLLNQRSITAYYQGMNSQNALIPLYPGLVGGSPVSLASGAALYQTLESGYNVQQWINGNGGAVPAVTKSSWYGQPFLYQLGRNMRFAVRFNF